MGERRTIEIAVRKQFDFPAETVYDAWLDENKVGEWLFATPKGVITRVEMDARIGGGYLIVDKRPEGEAEHFGEYVQLKRPRLIEFTFSVDRQYPGKDRVLIEIIPMGNACDVTLHHWMDAKWLEFMERTRESWLDILLGLECTLGHTQKTASP
jgi:uncharacterized protein YndB with AHSA1/START domain